MNWKINYWTIITLFLAGSLVYSCMDNQSPAKQAKWKQQINTIDENVEKVLEVVTATEDCNTNTDSLIISGKEAAGRILAYLNEMKAIKNSVARDMTLPVNFNFGFMKLPKCETQKMFEAIPGGEVYAISTIEPDPNDSTKQMMSLIFADTNIFDDEGKVIDDKGNFLKPEAAEALFFDYVTPCPPLCKD